MKEIKLSRGLVALVDDEDFEYLNQWKWYALKAADYTYYAIRSTPRVNGIQGKERMHRVIMNVTDRKVVVDHRDFNGLNCQKSNLRITDNIGNSYNTRPQKNRSSKYKGVSKISRVLKSGQKWQVSICANGKSYGLGEFTDETQAAKAYNEMAIKLHGEFAYLNHI